MNGNSGTGVSYCKVTIDYSDGTQDTKAFNNSSGRSYVDSAAFNIDGKMVSKITYEMWAKSNLVKSPTYAGAFVWAMDVLYQINE